MLVATCFIPRLSEWKERTHNLPHDLYTCMHTHKHAYITAKIIIVLLTIAREPTGHSFMPSVEDIFYPAIHKCCCLLLLPSCIQTFDNRNPSLHEGPLAFILVCELSSSGPHYTKILWQCVGVPSDPLSFCGQDSLFLFWIPLELFQLFLLMSSPICVSWLSTKGGRNPLCHLGLKQ